MCVQRLDDPPVFRQVLVFLRSRICFLSGSTVLPYTSVYQICLLMCVRWNSNLSEPTFSSFSHRFCLVLSQYNSSHCNFIVFLFIVKDCIIFFSLFATSIAACHPRQRSRCFKRLTKLAQFVIFLIAKCFFFF